MALYWVRKFRVPRRITTFGIRDAGRFRMRNQSALVSSFSISMPLAKHFDGAGFQEALAPIPHVGIVRGQFPARFHEGDGSGAGEGHAAMLEDGFERLEEVRWCHLR